MGWQIPVPQATAYPFALSAAGGGGSINGADHVRELRACWLPRNELNPTVSSP